MSIRRTWIKAAALLLAPVLMAGGGQGDKEPYVCSLTRAVECDRDLNCGAPALEQPTPTFIHVDHEASLITLLAPAERRGETTQIDASARDGDRVIMSGVEAGRGWTLSLSETDGSAVMTVNLGDAGYVAFGQCVASGLLSP
jgi:hypothetical protein